MSTHLLLEEVKGKNDVDIMEVVRFIRFLKQEGKRKRRNAGLFKNTGKGWMADDFDEPLSDFQEYMG